MCANGMSPKNVVILCGDCAVVWFMLLSTFVALLCSVLEFHLRLYFGARIRSCKRVALYQSSTLSFTLPVSVLPSQALCVQLRLQKTASACYVLPDPKGVILLFQLCW